MALTLFKSVKDEYLLCTTTYTIHVFIIIFSKHYGHNQDGLRMYMWFHVVLGLPLINVLHCEFSCFSGSSVPLAVKRQR